MWAFTCGVVSSGQPIAAQWLLVLFICHVDQPFYNLDFIGCAQWRRRRFSAFDLL
jgi:hypothetical protein